MASSDRRVGPRPAPSEVRPHLRAPEGYMAGAAALLGGTPTPTESADHNARAALVIVSRQTLLAENTRLSALLAVDPRSASTQESAALLLGAFALRETTGIFGDVRPALPRMTARLAAAHVLRWRTDTVDCALARIVLEVLAGHQREALTRLDRLAPRFATAADRAWDRALRLRITGNWRAPLDVA